MKRPLSLLIASALFSLTACGEVNVRPYPNEYHGNYSPADQYDITARINNQQKRINIGIEKGDLTRNEADMLQENLDHIRNEYNRMKTDGRLTRQEVDRLERDLEINDRMIQDKRSNQIRRLYKPMPAPVSQRDHERPAGIEDRIGMQQKRIDEGVRSGELTSKEAEIVQSNLNRIRSAYTLMKSDNRLSAKEQEKLEKDLDRNDRMIYNKKHNAIERFD